MFSVALLALLLPAANPAAVSTPVFAGATRAAAADPSVRISLDSRDYEPGDQARVTVRVRDDGYLLVLRLSPGGYVRVLFPLDPGQDNFVRGNGSYEIRGRGDRDAFTVSSSSGTGTVYAAWSTEPFRFDDYVLGDHWDYRVLDGSQIQGDPEAGLTELAQRMSTGHFDYDLVNYSVARQVAYTTGTTHYVTMYPSPYPYPVACYDPIWCGYGPSFGISVGFGWGGWRAGWYDPYYYDPFYYRPYYRYGGYYPRYYGCYGCGYRYPRVVVVNPPSYRGRYPYEFKPGSHGGGGAPGVQYRPRTAYASTGGQAQSASPLFAASKYRRVADGAKNQPASNSRRRPSTLFGAPVASGLGAGVGTARRDRGDVEVIRGGVRGGPNPPRRAGESNGVVDLRGNDSGTRVSPRVVDGVGAGNSSSQRRGGVDAPRRAEPLGATRGGSGVEAGTEPRRVEPRSVEPRTVEPRSVEPRTVQPRSVEPRSVVPRSTEPTRVEPRQAAPQRVQPRAEARRVEPRAQPQRVERSAPAQRAAPRSAPRASQPRSAPAPRVSAPRSAPSSRSAPAPRGRRP